MNEVIASLVLKKEYSLARKVKKVFAFDTRFPLYHEGAKCVYLLDVPVFDKHWEVHYNDGTKKLLLDSEARELLLKERDYNDNIREKAVNQIKNVNKFSKMGDLMLDTEKIMKEVEKEVPEALTEDNEIIVQP